MAKKCELIVIGHVPYSHVIKRDEIRDVCMVLDPAAKIAEIRHMLAVGPDPNTTLYYGIYSATNVDHAIVNELRTVCVDLRNVVLKKNDAVVTVYDEVSFV